MFFVSKKFLPEEVTQPKQQQMAWGGGLGDLGWGEGKGKESREGAEVAHTGGVWRSPASESRDHSPLL